MDPLEQSIDSTVKLFKQQGYSGHFTGIWAEGSLRDCLNYHLKRHQDQNGIDYFKDVIKLSVNNPKKENDTSKMAFTLEYREGQGINLTRMEAKRTVAGEERTGFQEQYTSLIALPSYKNTTKKLQLPEDKQSLLQRARIRI